MLKRASFSREPEFGSQHPCLGSQPGLGYLLLAFIGICVDMVYTHKDRFKNNLEKSSRNRTERASPVSFVGFHASTCNHVNKCMHMRAHMCALTPHVNKCVHMCPHTHTCVLTPHMHTEA